MFTTARRSGASTVSPAELLIVALVTLAFLLSFALPARAAESVTVTDLAGRTVSVKKGVARMILGEGRQLYGLAVLDRDDPFRRVVGWRDDLKVNDPDSWRKYKAKFPGADEIADLGNPYASDFCDREDHRSRCRRRRARPRQLSSGPARPASSRRWRR